ncbi:MAG: hypothetical protein ACRDHU_04445, partial [Actinomycetota bacterium]
MRVGVGQLSAGEVLEGGAALPRVRGAERRRRLDLRLLGPRLHIRDLLEPRLTFLLEPRLPVLLEPRLLDRLPARFLELGCFHRGLWLEGVGLACVELLDPRRIEGLDVGGRELLAVDAGLLAVDSALRGFEFGLRGFEFGLRGFEFGLRGFEFGLRGFEFGLRGFGLG